MPINLDQTGPAHLLSTDEDGLILNGSPVISKSIHISNKFPTDFFGNVNQKLLWLDTGSAGISVFPLGGAANYILRTDGNGTISWIPPSSIDATKFHYVIDSNNVDNGNPGIGKILFVRDYGNGMNQSPYILISGSDKAGNNISGFIDSLTTYGNSTRRGYIKVEKENNPNFFQIFSFSTVTFYPVGYFKIDITNVRFNVSEENFGNNDPVSITFTPAGPEALTQDLSPYVLLTGTQTVTNKTIVNPIISGLYLSDSSIVFEGSSNDNFETTLVAIDPTNDRTIYLPDASTTLVGNDTTQTLTNKTLTAPNISDPNINLTANNANIEISSGVSSAFKSRINTSLSNQYSWTTNLYYDGTSWLKDDNNRGAWQLNKISESLIDVDNKVVLAYASIGTNVVSNYLVISGDGKVSMPANISSTTTATGTLVITGGVGISENTNIGGDVDIVGTLTAGFIESSPIGNTFRSSGKFTTLSATQLSEVVDTTESNSITTGALVVSGGLGIGKAINATGPMWLNTLDTTLVGGNPTETKLTGYSLVLQNNQAKLRVGPNYTAGDKDYIDIITQQDNPIITTTSDNFTIENVKEASSITLIATSGSVKIPATTLSTSLTTGALQVAGGMGVELDIHANDIFVYGQTGLTASSQVVSLKATQTLLNKTLNAPVLNSSILTGSVTANGSTGIQGQLLSSTGSGVAWTNPSNSEIMTYIKASDQTVNPSGDISWSETPSLIVGSVNGFGTMSSGGIFTFGTTGTYQIIINFSVSVLPNVPAGQTYPIVDFWVKKNNQNTTKYCQVLTNALRRGSVSEVISFNTNDTLILFVNQGLVFNGTTTASRLSIVRLA
ncbi:hypothetical protein EB118_18615 [bacterium]|nr:hypothetical protein [Actinomycetota bacterium]NDG32075.1 hypothetical protein [bacterium]